MSISIEKLRFSLIDEEAQKIHDYRQKEIDEKNAKKEQIARQLELAKQFRMALDIPGMLDQARASIGEKLATVGMTENDTPHTMQYTPNAGIYDSIRVRGQRSETSVFDGSVDGWPTSYSRTEMAKHSLGISFGIALNKQDIYAPLELCYIGPNAGDLWFTLATLPLSADTDLSELQKRIATFIAQFVNRVIRMNLHHG